MHHDSTNFLCRYITVLYYLNDVPAVCGGHTFFPAAVNYSSAFAGAAGRVSCEGGGEEGLAVAARKGRAVVFYNYLQENNGDSTPKIDPAAVHAACPLVAAEKGRCGPDRLEKYAANHWVNL